MYVYPRVSVSSGTHGRIWCWAMMLAAEAIGEFVENNPTIKMLALSFLILVGTALLGEGMGFHIPKGYIYFAMAFAVGVELLNLKMRKNAEKPVKLTRHNP